MREACTIAEFDNFAEAELAARRLVDRGIAPEKMSIMTEGLYIEDRLQGFVGLKDKLVRWCGWAAFIGLLVGMTFYAWLFASYAVYGTVSYLMGRWAFYSIGAALAFAGITAIFAWIQNALARAPAEVRYRSFVGAARYGLILRGTDAEVARSRDLTKGMGISRAAA